MAYRPAAGIVVLRSVPEGWEMLLLVADDGCDLPKGGYEKGENALQCAMRETREESGIIDLSFHWGPVHRKFGGTTTMFVAETQEEPDVQPNPSSGILEHVGYEWVPLEDAASIMGDHYLAGAADWAWEIVNEEVG